MTTPVLPDAYRGDSYSFRLTFPDASYLTGSPADVLAQVRISAASATVAATWSVTKDSATSLVCSFAEVTLDPGTYVTDVQVGATTYLKATPFRVRGDVSRVVV